MKTIPSVLLRIGLGMVLLYFGWVNSVSPETWGGFIPSQVTAMLAPTVVMRLNGVMEIVLGILLVVGFWRRTAAAITALHIGGIAVLFLPADIGFRDLGLAFAALALSCIRHDSLSLDYWRAKKRA